MNAIPAPAPFLLPVTVPSSPPHPPTNARLTPPPRLPPPILRPLHPPPLARQILLHHHRHIALNANLTFPLLNNPILALHRAPHAAHLHIAIQPIERSRHRTPFMLGLRTRPRVPVRPGVRPRTPAVRAAAAAHVDEDAQEEADDGGAGGDEDAVVFDSAGVSRGCRDGEGKENSLYPQHEAGDVVGEVQTVAQGFQEIRLDDACDAGEDQRAAQRGGLPQAAGARRLV